MRAETYNPQRSHSFDMLGEGARTYEDSARYLASYAHAAEAIQAAGFRSPPDERQAIVAVAEVRRAVQARVRPGSVLQARVAVPNR